MHANPPHCPQCDAILDEIALATNICTACSAELGAMGSDRQTLLQTPQTPIETWELPVRGAEEDDTAWLDSIWDAAPDLPDADPRQTLSTPRQAVPLCRQSLHTRDVCHDPLPPDAPPDYHVLRRLGEGGMGIVYRVEQVSLQRTVALKMIKPAKADHGTEQEKFTGEAILTSHLDHPNIVPIHDLAQDASGRVFYTMRQVTGTPWSEVFDAKSLQENLDILLDVADAVAYAHSRGIIHRDIKPENVMLGDYGEVILMDWGLGAAVDEDVPGPRICYQNALAGTPAYMAPEMAAGRPEEIARHSDIYLLGGILFEIVTGQQPHSGATVRECLRNAVENIIDEPWIRSELVQTALKAMATAPEDRHASVKDFQQAIREHAQSIIHATRARKDFLKAKATQRYEDYARALFGFQAALEAWPENAEAAAGERDVRLAYARFALGKGDLGLAESLLSEGDPEQAELLREIRAARK